jgi:hypothetical protein
MDRAYFLVTAPISEYFLLVRAAGVGEPVGMISARELVAALWRGRFCWTAPALFKNCEHKTDVRV